MKIKRFFAEDVRKAMRLVREQLGEDAVILSNRRVNGGVEIISAVDYDETALTDAEEVTAVPAPTTNAAADVINNETSKPSVSWSQEPTLVEMRSEIKMLRGLLETQLANAKQKDQQHVHPFHYELRQRLARLGLGVKLTDELLNAIPEDGSIEELWRRVLGKIAVKIPVTDDDILTQGGVMALVGPTGVGKTTTIAKLAARFIMRYGPRSVALISTDNFRIGAQEQLRSYSRILDVPIRFANSAEELQVSLDYFCDKRLVLIDTAGMSQRDLRLSQQFSMLKRESERVKSYLVASATSRLSGLEEVVRGFSDIKLQGCILTKLDECTGLGHALDIMIRHDLPIAYLSDGQRVPEDLQPARTHTLVSRSVAIMQDNLELLSDELPGMRVEAGS